MHAIDQPDYDHIPEKTLEFIENGKGAAIAVVLETWQSAPRPVGSQLAISMDGDFVGSVSGGCVESDVVAEAVAGLQSGPKILEYGISDENAFSVGLSCGGAIKVILFPIDVPLGIPIDVLWALVKARKTGQAAILLVNLKTWEYQLRVGLMNDFPPPLRNRLYRDQSGSEGDHFAIVYSPPLRLIVVGAVHIAQPLLRIANVLNYQTDLIDPRTSFASAYRFPGYRLTHAWPDKAIKLAKPDGRTAIVTLTHNAEIDDAALIVALASDAFYIGCLGSVKTHQKRLARLAAIGVEEHALKRLHGPVGLDIGAVSPAEIAVAIVGEMIQMFRTHLQNHTNNAKENTQFNL